MSNFYAGKWEYEQKQTFHVVDLAHGVLNQVLSFRLRKQNSTLWYGSVSNCLMESDIILNCLFVMGGLPMQNASTAPVVSQVSVITNSAKESKPKKKICCACPETKKLRDECIVEHGEAACAKWIEAHRLCLRAEGFNI
ncbi:hypothetical protein POTOM_061736 [Populus tomentosa]|uniref:Cytochrome c oxidase copper chaperone n=1 Tax=Populus tomentosa TaxID=118781 RepID=A0A8X7XLU8_POPTO|nr:hypothetical protein POTOM_061736 [Populus tomentosa]